MAVQSGFNQAFKFGSTTYGATACIQDGGLSDAVEAAMYQCSGVMKTAVGPRTASQTFSLALSSTDLTKIQALEPGDTGAWRWYPNGTGAGTWSVKATKATIIDASKSAPVNGVITMDLTVNLDSIVYQASTAS